MPTELGRMGEHNENFYKERENVRKYQTEVTEVNTTDKCTRGAQEQTKQSRMVQQASEQRSGTHPHKAAKGEKKKKRENLTHEDNLRNLLDNVKQNNIHIIEVLEEEEKRGQKSYLKKYS